MLAFHDLEVVIQPTFNGVDVGWVLLSEPIGRTVFLMPDESFLSVVVLATFHFSFYFGIGDGGFEISSEIDRSVIRRWISVSFWIHCSTAYMLKIRRSRDYQVTAAGTRHTGARRGGLLGSFLDEMSSHEEKDEGHEDDQSEDKSDYQPNWTTSSAAGLWPRLSYKNMDKRMNMER